MTIDWTQFTDDQLAQRDDWLTKQIAELYSERSEIRLEQTRRRIAERYARWRGKKSDIQYDCDMEAEAQGVNTRDLLR